jgi:DNA repair protein RadC
MADKHDPLELEWFQLGLSGPARSALVNAKLYRVSDLRKISLQELIGMHGMGKSSVARIRVIMDAKKIRFRP